MPQSADQQPMRVHPYWVLFLGGLTLVLLFCGTVRQIKFRSLCERGL
jgi:hypothetical protein